MPLPDQVIYATQDVGNARHCNGNPNTLGVPGNPGWTCQDWANGRVYVCTAVGTANCAAFSTSGATLLTVLATLDFGSLAPTDAHERTVALPGALVNDAVALGLPAVLPSVHVVFDGRVSAPGVITIRAINYDGGNITVGVQTIRATILR